MRLIIVKGSIASPDPQPDSRVITFADLKRGFRSLQFWRQHLLHYREATLLTYRLDTITRPLLMALLLRLFSYGTIAFEDARGHVLNINLPAFIRMVLQFCKDAVRRIFITRHIKKAVDEWLTVIEQTPVPETLLDLSGEIVYLRTDMAFGHMSGGSVAHICGVLNHFCDFADAPILISTDAIPGVDPCVQEQIVPFPPAFWDFPEMLTMSSGQIMKDFAETHLQEKQIAFIYQRYSLNNYTGLELARRYGVPLVLEYNGSDIWITENWRSGSIRHKALARNIELLNFRAADLIVVVSQPLKDELLRLGIAPEKILVNYNGVDPEKYTPAIDGQPVRERYALLDKIVIGFIGTFGAWHGAEVLAAAFGQLLHEYPAYREDVRLLLIGDGIKMPAVKHNLTHYGVMDEAILTGFVPQHEGPHYLAACDILASPHIPNPDGTPFFGSPTKLFEYMAMAKGIVASDLDQVGEVLSHLETAYMVRPASPEDLVRGLKHLIDDPSLRDQLGKTARQEVIAKYTWHEHTRKIIDQLAQRTARR